VDACGIEDEAFGDHAVVVGAERREVQFVGELHRRNGGPLRQRGDTRAASCRSDDRLVHLAQRNHVVGADVEDIGTVIRQRLQAGCGEILSVDELVSVAAVADNPDLFSVIDELEENGEQAEPAAIDDGGTSEDNNVEIVRVAGENLFGG